MGEKFGYINFEGDLVIDVIFDRAYNFSEGYAAVKSNNIWKYINEKGEVQLVLDEVSSVDIFSDGLALIRIKNKVGYIDHEGKIVISPEYFRGSRFNEGIAYISSLDKDFNEIFSFISKDGNILFGRSFQLASEFSEGYSVVQEIGDINRSLIDVTGKTIFAGDDLIKIVGNTVSQGLVQISSNDKVSFFDIKNEKILDFGDKYPLSNFVYNKVIMEDKKTGLCGILDINNHWIIPPSFPLIYGLTEKTFLFTEDDFTGIYIIISGILAEPEFVDILSFDNGMARFNSRDGVNGGYINFNGERFYAKDYLKILNKNN